MWTAALFSVVVFTVMAALCLFIAVQSPKGHFRSWDYNRLPGVMTGNTLRSREAWVKAHRATAPYFLLLAGYFMVAMAVNLVLLWQGVNLNMEVVFTATLLVGIAAFTVLVGVGDRAAVKETV